MEKLSNFLYVIAIGISSIGFYYVHLAEDLKMIGIIMAIKGLILLDLCLGAYSEWFVHLELKGFINFCMFHAWFLFLIYFFTCAAIQKID